MIKRKLAGIILAFAATNLSSTPVMAVTTDSDRNVKSKYLTIVEPKNTDTLIKLDEMINEISKMNTINYTEQSWINLFNVKEEVLESLVDNCDKKKLDNLYLKLKIAMDNLEPVIEYDEIEVMINRARELKDYLYTENTYNELIDLVDEAERLIFNDSTSKSQVEKMNKDLTEAFNKLNFRDDKKELEDLLKYADTINDMKLVGTENLKQVRWYNFTNIREISRDTLYDTQKCIEECNLAISRLKYYIDELMIK